METRQPITASCCRKKLEKVRLPGEIHDNEDADTSENLRHTHIMFTMCQAPFEFSIKSFNPHNHPRERKLRFSEVR